MSRRLKETEYDKAYYQKHKERIRAYYAKYREEHREELRIKQRIRRKLDIQFNPRYWRIHEAKYLHPCADCQTPVSRHAMRCCSCHFKRIWRLHPERMKHPKGKNHPQWKGGRKKWGNYMGVYMPDHPKAIKNYIYEHTYIWEKQHKIPLPEGWVIHHLNGIKTDNRLRNLLALPKGKHHSWLVQNALRKRIQELEGLLNGQRQLL